MKILKSVLMSGAICLGALLASQRSSLAQPCGLIFSPNPGTASVTIEAYWTINNSYTNTNNLAMFRDTVTVGNSTVPPGSYLGWCIDVADSIDNGPEGYSVLMFSSCDPNLDTELANLGYSYSFTYPSTDTNTTAAQWNQVNYILNHKLSGASYWDINAAIFNIVGGPLPPNSFFHNAGFTNLTYNSNNVSAMTQAALSNAATWQPQCGDVIAAILAITAKDTSKDFPVQLTIIEVPFPCAPCIGVTKQVACLQPGNACGAYGPVAEGFAGATCSGAPDGPAFCYEITVTNCGSIPLTNVTVSDNLLGNLTTNFFISPTTVFEPGASVTAYFSMSFATNATNHVLVQGAADLAGTVTNGSEVFTNGTPVAATASATALVTPASISCGLSLSSPYVSPTNSGGNVLILPEILPDGAPVTVSVTVVNTGASPLSAVTIVPPTGVGFTCPPPPTFSLPAGGSTNITLCSDSVTCPIDQSFSVVVTGVVDSDATHCGVYDLSGHPIIVCSSCPGTVECSGTGGCTITNELSGTVVLDCVVGSTNLTGDTGLSGWMVSLYGSSSNLLTSTTTDSKGNYAFYSLGSGSYTVVVTLPAGYAETYPLGVTNGQQTVTVVACENTTGVIFGFAETTPPQISVPPGQYLSCNPTNLPSDASIASNVTAVVSCGTPNISVTHSDTNTSCSYTRTYLITVTDTYGNLATNNIVYSWISNSTPLAITGTPTNSDLGCNPATLPTAYSVTNGMSASNACGSAPLSVTNVLTTNACLVTDTFTISAVDACGNTGSSTVVYTWTANPATLVISGTPAGGYLGCNPANLPTDASVIIGVSASNACGSAPLSVTNVLTTSGCTVTDSFTISAVDACGNIGSATVVYTWTANPTPLAITGAPAGGYLGCNPANLPTDASVISGVSASNTCGSVPLSVTNVLTTNGCLITNTFTISAVDACGNTGSSTMVYSWTTNTTPPIISGVPTNTFLGCNGYTNLPSDTTVSNAVKVGASCGTAAIRVTHVDGTNGCSGTRVFTITATDSCGNIATASVTYSWTVNSVGPIVTCPPDVTIITNFCQMYCTFSAGDWGGSCNGGSRYNNNWWQNWCGQNSSSQCWPSWTNWWNSCNGNGNNNQYGNFWGSWNNNHPTNWWGGWSGQSGNQWNQTGNWWGSQSGYPSGYWYNSWNNGNYGSQNWVPCGGNNPDSILGSCFGKVYPKGCVTVGLPGSGKCVTVTSCSAAQTCLNWGGNPGVLNGCATNPSSGGAGSFCAQVLALQLNCDFGDYGCVPGFVGKCGDLVLCDSTSPCNGKKVRDILGLCNSALGGGSCPQGCTVQYLSGLCSNLNQCFRGCQVSSWCHTHLCSVYIPLPAQTGTATVSAGCCANATLTYCDAVSSGKCSGSYVISREWIAVDACGNTNTCTQLITILSGCVTNQICGNFNSQSPGGGYVWCNAHLSCNPGQKCTVYCQNASVTLTCNDGKTYTYPVPDCQINFSPNSSGGSCVFDGTKWTTTLPCAGDDEIFLSGCGIPWQSDFANCHSVCWNGSFSCDTAGINCNWQWSAACYKCNLSNCGSIGVKPCHNTPCGYPGGDHAGTPENCKSYCQGGAGGGGGGNYTGSWSSTGSFTCH
jgi:hypothetical protein